MLIYVNSLWLGQILPTFVKKGISMNRNFFSKISVAAVICLTLLAVVQCYWTVMVYNDWESDFKRRVESAAYKSVYKVFRDNAIPGIEIAEIINIDIEEFDIIFTANLLELDIIEPHFAEILDTQSNNRVLMRYGSRESLGKDFMTTRIVIDDEGSYLLELSTHIPYDKFWKNMKWLLISSILIVLLLASLLLFLVRTMFRQRTLEQMRKDFTRNITHELKTPIAVATAATDALKNHSAEKNPQRRERYLDIIGVQLGQLSGMVEKILSVSVEGKENNLSRELIDPAALIEEIVAGYEDIDATFSLNFGSRAEIVGDRFHLKNVLATIIDNAVKYSQGRPIIDINVENSGKWLKIRVADNGIGISRENIRHIFEKFYRVPQGDVQNTRGYGIGLHYAKRIIEAHGGTIAAESRLGKGTVITVELPLQN